MKKRKLHKILNDLNFVKIRSNKHEIWFDGLTTITVPNHGELNFHTAKILIKQAEKGFELINNIDKVV